MSRERHRLVRDLFLQVCDLEPADREPVLATLDEEIRREVDALLAIHDSEPTHALIPGAETLAGLAAGDGPFPLIHDYRLSRLIGEGGMGRVYEAEQQHPVRRRVAVKVLKAGLAGRHVIARFESERQTLALMNHPNVARVLDAGTTDEGEPFFAMELVEGEAITAHCERRLLSVEERLRLFVEVCHGVQHAHQRGILHRDLKPTNILVSEVDSRPLPVIIDFGIAKAVGPGIGESSVETAAGHLIGTPAYMSPEQLSLDATDLDTRADVYSLGVILYELLTGAVPFELEAGGGFDELRERIRQQDPVRPSVRSSADTVATAFPTRTRLRRRLRGDLDWITLKALAKDRADRYASVSELAADVERHLEGQPVLAGPPSTLYRVQKFVRRHRLAVAAGIAVALALVLGLAGTSVGLVRARRAESDARQQARTAQEVARFLVDIFQVADPSKSRGEIIDARQILEGGARRIDTELAGEPVIRAALMRTMGQVYRNLGLYDEAEPLLERALKLQIDELGEDDPQVAATRVALAWLYRSQGKLAEAQTILELALPVLETSADADPRDYIWALRMVGVILRDRGEHDAARRYLERSIEVSERLLGTNDVATAWSRYHLAWLENLEANYATARALYEQVLPIFERQLGKESTAVAWCLNDLGVVLQQQEEYEASREVLERSIAIDEKVLGPDHPDLAAPLQNLATVRSRSGDEEGAVDAARRAVELREWNLGPDHPELAGSLANLGFYLVLARKPEEAEAAYKRSLAITESALGVDHPDYASTLNNLASLYRETGRVDEARPLIERALHIQEAALGPDHPDLAATLSNLAVLLLAEGSLDEAQVDLERALAIRERALGPQHVQVALNLCHLGDVQRLRGHPAQAADLVQQGLAILSPDSRPLAGMFHERVFCLLVDAAVKVSLGTDDLGEPSYSEAQALIDAHPEWVLPGYAVREASYWALRGERERALDLLRQVIEDGYRDSWMDRDPDFESLHGDPEFERLMELARP